MTFRRPRGRAPSGENGTTIVFVALTMVIMLIFLAYAIDVTSLSHDKQRLHDTLDMAAHSAATKLPADPDGARSDALAFLTTNYPEAPNPTVDLWCVVGSISGNLVNSAHIPKTCNPGPGPYNVGQYPGLRCNSKVCAIPCSGLSGTACNTIRLANQKDVPYAFAPVIGVEQGSTGAVVSTACHGTCGGPPVNPMDMVVVADRTGSMSGYYDELGAGIQSLLKVLNPSVQSVALGTISMSSKTAPASCPTQANGSVSSGGMWVTDGTWIPVGLSSDYQASPATEPVTLNNNSALVKGVNCIAAGNNSDTGTWLAAPMQAAASYLLASGRPSASKVILFETDGEPNERDVSASPYGSTNGNIACTNAQTQATNAKNAGILVVSIAFRLQGRRCDGSTAGSSPAVTSVLASMASPESAGVPSIDDGGGLGAGCDTPEKVNGENADRDFFYCTTGTPNAADLRNLYETAVGQVTKTVKLIRLP